MARGIANRHDQVLAAQGYGDAALGYLLRFDAPLLEAEVETIEVWPATALQQLPRAGSRTHGYTSQRRADFVAGWVQDATTPLRPLAVEVFVVRNGTRRVVGRGIADRRDRRLAAIGHQNPDCSFRIEIAPPVGVDEVPHLVVRTAGGGTDLEFMPVPLVGYVRERGATHVAGWLQDADAPALRQKVEVVVMRDGAAQVIAKGLADRPDPLLAAAGHDDTDCGFRIVLPPAWHHAPGGTVMVRAARDGATLADADSAVIGYIRERTARHVAGWMRNPVDPGDRVAFEVVSTRPGAERLIARGVADRYDRVLAALGIGDALHGFRVIFTAPVDAADVPFIAVRTLGSCTAIPDAPDVQTEWRPLRYVAMDIVDNCNLRCPFCLFDHAPVHRTNVMADETFEAAIRLLPFVGIEGHWMSCLHEPSMHPNLTGFLRKIPRQHAHVMTYTTNLAKRMPDDYFATLADSGLSNINVSIESRDPAIYERMRKGARFRIFMENWDKLLAAFAKGAAPPPLRYIAMAYKSNYREIPELIEYLRNERNAWKVEIRDTYDVAHIPPEFRAAEFLEPADWRWLRDALGHYSPHEVVLVLPSGLDAPSTAEAPATPAAEPAPVPPTTLAQQANDAPGMIEARIFHDGEMIVYTSPDGNYPNYGTELARLNIRDIADPAAFLMEMSERTMV